MTILETIKSKLDKNINLENLTDRLTEELTIKEYCLYEVILDVIIIMLNYTHQEKIEFLQRTTLINMIKDYCDLKSYNELSSEEKDKNSLDMKVKSISVGDTTTTFIDTQSQVNVNGITYNTGTIEYDKNVLIEKYANELNKYRKIRW